MQLQFENRMILLLTMISTLLLTIIVFDVREKIALRTENAKTIAELAKANAENTQLQWALFAHIFGVSPVGNVGGPDAKKALAYHDLVQKHFVTPWFPKVRAEIAGLDKIPRDLMSTEGKREARAALEQKLAEAEATARACDYSTK